MNLVYAHPSNLDRAFARSLQIAHTVNALAETGIKVFFLKGQNDEKVSDHRKFRSLGITLHANVIPITIRMLRPPRKKVIRVSWNLVAQLSILRHTLKLRERESIDVIYTRDLRLARMLLRMRHLLGRCRIVLEIHDLQTFTRPEKRRLVALEREVLGHIDGLVAISPGLKTYAEKIVGRSLPCLIAPSGVDLSRFRPIGPNPGANTVTYTGSLYGWKGVHYAIEAMSYVAPPLRLEIVGGRKGSPRFDALKAMVSAKRLHNRVQLRPFIPQENLSEIYRKTRAFLLPLPPHQPITTHFTSPLKLFEYMALEIPILASDIPSLNWLLKHEENALLFKPGNPRSIAAAITRITTDPHLSAMLARRARKDVQAYSWKARAKRIARWLTTLTETTPPSPHGTETPA